MTTKEFQFLWKASCWTCRIRVWYILFLDLTIPCTAWLSIERLQIRISALTTPILGSRARDLLFHPLHYWKTAAMARFKSLWQLWCHCNPDHDKFSSLSNTTVVAIFPNVCLWRRSLCSNLAGIDPEKLYRGTFICQDGLCCCIVWPSFLFDCSVKIWATLLAWIFWANGLPPP